MKVIQTGQVAVQNNLLKPTLSGARRSIEAPWPVKLLNRHAWLSRWPAELIGLGVRREHVRSSNAPN